VTEIVSLLDLVPTLVALTAGTAFPGQGRSLLPLLNEEKPDWQSEAYAECHGQRFNYTQRVLWQDEHKYVFNGFAEDELYDLRADPHELTNLAGDPQQRDLLESMAARMWAIMRQTEDATMVNAQYGMFRYAPVGPQLDKG
jgi:arylsulfatase A-like enzyme